MKLLDSARARHNGTALHLTAALFLTAASAHVFGALRLPAVISDHAVLRASKPVAIWGWASPGEAIHGTFLANSGATTAFDANAGSDGRWSGQLPALPSGAAGRMEVKTDRGEVLRIEDLLVGEVWLCSGQSNMSYILNTTTRGRLEDTPPEMLAEATRKASEAAGAIRYFSVREARADMPQDDVQGSWIVATPEAVSSNYSAGDAQKNGYHAAPAGMVDACFSLSWNFAVALRDKLHCPVGVINSAVGGTSIELWSPRPEFVAAMGKEVEKQWSPGAPNQIGCLYNAMIHGLEPYTLSGVLWFQGDANLGNWQQYGILVKSLVTTWRTHWRDDMMAFYYAEMQNYGIPQKEPVEHHNLCLIRERQQAALELPGTDVATAVDLGIKTPEGVVAPPHFPDKAPLGRRLAGLALNDLYGQPGLVHSPQLKSFQIEGDRMRLKFDFADGLRVRGAGGLKGFAIRSADGPWTWAEGRIEGETILLWNEQVAAPAEVRYGWAQNPILSVENAAGLPLRPFRTDLKSKE